MSRASVRGGDRLQKWLVTVFSRPQFLAFLPALTLTAYWLGGEPALIVAAVVLPLLATLVTPERARPGPPTDARTGLPLRETLVDALDLALAAGGESGLATAAIAIEIDGLDEIDQRFGAPAAERALEVTAGRLAGALRTTDTLGRLDGSRFAVALAPQPRADLETLLQIAGRLQEAARAPISIEAGTAHLSSSAGFCLEMRSPARAGAALLQAAEIALREAAQVGPGAIRAFTAEMQTVIARRHDLIDAVGAAIESGVIQAWFQPQLSTDTGDVSGFEALARWPHPERGMIPPAEFMPAIEQAGLSERLSAAMLYASLAALRAWENAGLHIPRVSVNLSAEELRDPGLVDRVRWELDRFNLHPARLTVEITEAAVSEVRDDVVTHNLRALGELGCGIDLDDFGTGHASIATVRRHAVRRLKLDRSFVTHVDSDRNQQQMIAAILTMAERLGLETVAVGVERIGEHAMLAQLGCDHVQGFGIARPMPVEDTPGWVRKHREKLTSAPDLRRRAE